MVTFFNYFGACFFSVGTYYKRSQGDGGGVEGGEGVKREARRGRRGGAAHLI